MSLEGIEFYGVAVDIAKYFDQINRALVYMLMKAAGIPTKVLDAYARFQEELKVRNTIGGGLGQKYKARMGVPQGDPFSMMAAAIVMRPWAVMMREAEMNP